MCIRCTNLLLEQVVDVRNKQIMKAIEGYLMQHPEAADSVEGIARWWLPEMGLVAGEKEVADALEHRRADSPIEEQRSASGRVIYRLRDIGSEADKEND